VANSYVRPTVSKYLGNLEKTFAETKMKAKYKVLRSDGGLMAFGNAADQPVALMMSGPAGGVAGALWVSRQSGFKNLLTFDTEEDVAVALAKYTAELSAKFAAERGAFTVVLSGGTLIETLRFVPRATPWAGSLRGSRIR
jgi:N-methylhydantoinase A